MKIVSVVVLILWSIVSNAQWSYRGYNRAYLSSSDSHHHGGVNHRSEGFFAQEDFTFEVAYELLASDVASTPITGRFRYDDLNPVLQDFEDSKGQISQNLDRLYVEKTMHNWNLSLGRQVVSFGSARTVNPIDILVPFSFTVFEIEQRLGVDAAVVKYSSSELNTWEAGLVVGEDAKQENNVGYITYQHSFSNLDAEVVLMSFAENYLYGLDIQSDYKGYGVWAEVAWMQLQEEIGDSFLRASVGLDRLLNYTDRDVSYFLEYHFSGSKNVNKSLLGIFLTGENYLNVGASTAINPLNSVQISMMSNINDSSSLLAPRWEWNFKQDYYLSVGGYIGIGPAPKAMTLGSEFASYPETVYFIIKSFL